MVLEGVRFPFLALGGEFYNSYKWFVRLGLSPILIEEEQWNS
jgi:hypothetical protein